MVMKNGLTGEKIMKRETWVSITTRRLRREKAMSKEELARRVGVHPHTIRNIETGRNLPNITTLEAMLYELNHELVAIRIDPDCNAQSLHDDLAKEKNNV